MKTKNDGQIQNDFVSKVTTFADYKIMLKGPASNIFFLDGSLNLIYSQFNDGANRKGTQGIKTILIIELITKVEISSKYHKWLSNVVITKNKGNNKSDKSYIPGQFSDKVTSDIDFKDEAPITQCSVTVVQILLMEE